MAETVFITGASRGIGRAAAKAFGMAGYRVAVGCNINRDAARELIAQFASAGVMAEIVEGDVADENSVRDMVNQAQRALGHISVLINNAGVSCDALFTDTTPDMWQRTFDVNARGAYNTCRAVLPDMISRGCGSIINVSSVWGIYGGACEAAYSASKAALIGLTKALARETGPSGIRVNCIAPGVIDTDMLKRLSQNDRNMLVERTPLCRLGTPEDVAGVMLFLASPAAAFITGQVIGVDGGFIG